MAHRKKFTHDFELNLTPIIDCFVTLICFMLLSATYMTISTLDAKVPIAGGASTQEQVKEEPFYLEMKLVEGQIILNVRSKNKNQQKKFEMKTFSPQELEVMHKELVEIKKVHPKEFSLHFDSKTNTSYENLIKLMDWSRKIQQGAQKFSFIDERNGKPTETDFLFPDFILENMTQ